MWSFKHKKPDPELLNDPEVVDANRRMHEATDKAVRGSKKLNAEFRENGITLTILRTAGGQKHVR